MNTLIRLVPILLAIGCTSNYSEPYFDEAGGLTVSGVDSASEPGNFGGKTVTVQGSGFGTDPAQLTVLFGHMNAEILNLTDSEITVRTPRGPIPGGPVDVTVTGENGYDSLADAYDYTITTIETGSTTPSGFFDDEAGAIIIKNYQNTNYGGAGWVGLNGIDAFGSFLKFEYPRFHTYNQNWFPETGFSPVGELAVRNDPYFIGTSALDDLHEPSGNFSIMNPANYGAFNCITWDTFALGRDHCVASGLASGTHTLYLDGYLYYDTATLPVCLPKMLNDMAVGEYSAEWPLPVNYFNSINDDGSVDIDVVAPDLGLSETRLKLPPKVSFEATAGFTGDWTSSLFSSCFDSDGDGDTTLSDTALRFEWTPYDGDLGDVPSQTWVKFDMSAMSLTWIGLDTFSTTTSLQVPDFNNYDPETGLSSIEIPVSTLYQMATTAAPPRMGLADANDTSIGYTFLSLIRTTDYKLGSSLDGDVIVSYVTGDFTLLNFQNPLDSDTCGNCLDDDHDGWTDADDPDCDPTLRGDDSTPAEDNVTFGNATCNDGEDNDADGLVDSDDPDCTIATDTEGTIADLGCVNGIDDDGDGWIDDDDPDCTTETDVESGFTTIACNDGVDNDGHGDADALDPYCDDGLGRNEQPTTWSSSCSNDIDDDGDGYVDSLDPDCELGSSENRLYWTVDDFERSIPSCYDGLDNDSDGLVDHADPDCVNGDAQPDGFLRTEAS
jgi:hypothetical protein